MLKPEIHDPQGDAIASACRRMGFGQVAAVRQGKRFELELTEPASRERMAELAAELLANPVIEEFSIEALGHPGALTSRRTDHRERTDVWLLDCYPGAGFS